MDPDPCCERPFRPLIRTQADLERAWRHLMEPLGFAGASIWLMLIDGTDHPLPQVTQITEADDPPHPEELDGFAEMLLDLQDLAPGGRWAFLRTRPGVGGPSAVDLAWATSLLEACRKHGIATDVVHLATDHDLVPLPCDALAASA